MDALNAVERSLPAGSKLGPYLIERRVAAGGMAEIYLARAQGMAGFEKQIAIKVIHAELASDPMFVKMLVAEAKIAVQLAHANIVQTFDLGKVDDAYFITMEYIDGSDYFELLRSMSNRGREMPIEAALYVAHEVASALDYAHQKTDGHGQPLGLIHRDISPQNILLSRHGQVKIADFGIAKVANASSQTRTGTIKGKLVYMSPEQAWGERVDGRSDIFSAGVVLYEALTGGSIYTEENPVKLLHHVRKAEIPPPSSLRSEIGEDLDAVVMKAMARKPEERYQSAAAFGADVTAVLRRISPSYGSRELAQLVCSIAGADSGTEGATKTRRRGAAGAQPAAEAQTPAFNYGVSHHSLIFDSDEPTPIESPSAFRAQVREPPRPEPASVVLVKDDGSRRPFELGEELLIGRSNTDLGLTDGRVSRRHARIFQRDGGYHVEDLKSANGTLLNRKRIDQTMLLRAGDVISVGPYELHFNTGVPEISTRPAASRAKAEGPSADQPRGFVNQPIADPDAPTPLPNIAAQVPNAAAEVPPAVLVLELADQTMRLPIDAKLVLDHKLDVGTMPVPVLHATVLRRDDGYWIETTSGQGVVVVNDQTVAQSRRLSSGDQLKVGFIQATFSTDPEDA